MLTDLVRRDREMQQALPLVERDAAATYEERLNRDRRWALTEGSRHFEEKSAVFEALRKITRRLEDLGVPYAVVGGMALFQHGFRRFTEDVDILVTPDDLKTIHRRLEGHGYLPPHRHSKHLRDTELGVRIEFLTTGEFPGDGKSKPVKFPEPTGVTVELDGIKYLNLETLVELKLASGMTGLGRLRDHSDVLELIKLLNLPSDFASRLDPYVQGKYEELWSQTARRYITLWRNKWLTATAQNVEEMVVLLRAAADHLDEMRKDGVVIQSTDGVADDYVHLLTTDPAVARKYDMVEETEFWGYDAQEDDSEGDVEQQ